MTSTIVVADPNAKFRAKAAQHIGRNGSLQEAADSEEAGRILHEHEGQPAVLVLGPSIPAAEKLAVARAVQDEAPNVSVVLVAGKLTNTLLQGAMRAGVRDVLPTSCTPDQFREAVKRAEQLAEALVGTPTPQEGRGTGGRVTTVFSAKGGCGKSVLSTNLGILLSERTEGDVALVDLDLDSGDLAIMLRLDPTRTIFDAAQNVERLDAAALKSYMTPYRDNLYLLAAPLEPGLGEKITPEAIRRMLAMLRESFDHVIVDGPSFFTEQVLASLDESDECILVASLDVPSVKNLKVALRTFNLLGFSRDRVRLVLNRADSKVGLGVDEVEKALQSEIEMLIPSSRDVPLCVNRGIPIASAVSKSSVTAAIGRLADVIRNAHSGTPAPAPSHRHPRFRRRKGDR
jgi:pilus assembly protein CpaE